MGPLNKFFRNVSSEEMESSFAGRTEAELAKHMEISRYGTFELTEAIRPSYDLQIIPSAGYRHDICTNPETDERMPVIIAAETCKKLFALFLALLDPLGEEVDVVLETSHNHTDDTHDDLYREHIDLPVLQSILYDFEDLLVNDGCTGIAVRNPQTGREVQLNDGKIIFLYGKDLEDMECILQRQLECRKDILFIIEAEHVHCSSDEYKKTFARLKYELGLDGKGEDEDPDYGWNMTF